MVDNDKVERRYLILDNDLGYNIQAIASRMHPGTNINWFGSQEGSSGDTVKCASCYGLNILRKGNLSDFSSKDIGFLLNSEKKAEGILRAVFVNVMGKNVLSESREPFFEGLEMGEKLSESLAELKIPLFAFSFRDKSVFGPLCTENGFDFYMDLFLGRVYESNGGKYHINSYLKL